MGKPSLPPDVEEIAKALTAVVTSGLPLPPDYLDERLLGLPIVTERCQDPEDRINRVAVVETVLAEALADFSDDSRRDALRALFGIAHGAREKKVSERRVRAAGVLDRDPEHFRKRIEPKLLDALAMQLYRSSVSVLPARPSVAHLGPRVLADLRQVFRYAQETLLLVEVHEQLSYCSQWLFDEGNRYAEQARAFPCRFIWYQDHALWTFAYFRKYLNRAMGDPGGREFLREHLSSEWWQGRRVLACFDETQEARLIEVLAESKQDEPRELIGNLYGDLTRDMPIHTSWLAMMASCTAPRPQAEGEGHFRPAYFDRHSLISDLLELSSLLQQVFPDDTLQARRAEARFQDVLDTVGTCGLLESHVSRDDPEGQAAFAMLAKTYDRRPSRYRSGVTERVHWPRKTWE